MPIWNGFVKGGAFIMKDNKTEQDSESCSQKSICSIFKLLITVVCGIFFQEEIDQFLILVRGVDNGS